MIQYKSITHERTEDAPFIGALICAIDCKFNCNNCFNQELKDLPNKEDTIQHIISEIKSNPFNKGIILAGLEWTLQSDEMRVLILEALENKLQVILYTGMTEDIFKIKFFDVYQLPIYIKFGQYDDCLSTNDNVQFGIKLASMNQYIRKG